MIFMWYLLTFLIGAFVGITEILSRYRDEPWKAAFSQPGVLYMAVNGLVSTGAFWIITNYQIIPGVDQAGFPAAMAAASALRSAHCVKPYDAFSTLQPV